MFTIYILYVVTLNLIRYFGEVTLENSQEEGRFFKKLREEEITQVYFVKKIEVDFG